MSIIDIEYKNNETIKIIYLNQEGGNKFTGELLDGLKKNLEDEDQLTGIIITSKQDQFSVGGDLYRMHDFLKNNNPEGYIDLIVPKINEIIINIVNHRLPIIAAINGSAAGGGLSLALVCDYRIAVPTAKLSMAFGKLALSPDSGSTMVFPLRFGLEEALFGITTGKIYTSEEAVQLGAINYISENIIDVSINIITDISSKSLWTYSKTKELLKDRLWINLSDQLDREYLMIRESTKKHEFHQKLVEMIENMSKKND